MNKTPQSQEDAEIHDAWITTAIEVFEAAIEKQKEKKAEAPREGGAAGPNWVRFHKSRAGELAAAGFAWFRCATCDTEASAATDERPAACACTAASLDELSDFSSFGLQRCGGR